jgi:hypothetical protein
MLLIMNAKVESNPTWELLPVALIAAVVVKGGHYTDGTAGIVSTSWDLCLHEEMACMRVLVALLAMERPHETLWPSCLEATDAVHCRPWVVLHSWP